MPQKRNPYSLSIVRGASGVLIGRLTGFLAVTKSPSARSDNLIFAYGEVPRALDLAMRVTRLMTGVVRTLRGQRRPDARGARRRIHPGDRPGRVHRAGMRRRLPHRLRRGRQAVREASQPGIPAGTSPARCSTRPRSPRPGSTGAWPATDLTRGARPRAIVETRRAPAAPRPRPSNR